MSVKKAVLGLAMVFMLAGCGDNSGNNDNPDNGDGIGGNCTPGG